MEAKYISSALLALTGSALAVIGFIRGETGYLNLGLAALFLTAIVLTFKSSSYVKKGSLNIMIKSQRNLANSLLEGLALEGKSVYLPPYKNLPDGGVFIPLREDFDLDPARFDEGSIFVTDVPDERKMGLLLPTLGKELVEKYEEHLEGPLTSIPEVESAAGSVLKSLNLARRVYIEEEGSEIRVIVSPDFECPPINCERFPCPICASILRGIAKASGEVIAVESLDPGKAGVEIKARRMGRVEEWM
ncbi:hypothetical protein [Thermococcus sp.]|uniref:hypothetical protein n=1 Tax=Thermococcus sp. TaxID=35749 RepID=UPI00262347E6|nr:hypothetical protein [Thermococcus sp.]